MEHEGQDEDEHEAPAGVPVLGGSPLADALERSLAALAPDARDEALGVLLGAYARELDGAHAQAARAARVAQEVADEHGRESALYERVAALQGALSRRQALDRIGARFHAGLVEMLGTPRARGAGKPAVPPAADDTAKPSGSPLARLRLASGAE